MRQCLSALVWLHWQANFDSYCINPDILGEKRAKSGRVGGCMGVGGWVGNSGRGSLAVHVFQGKCRLFAKGWGSLCRNGWSMAYPVCGRSFRPVPLCLAQIGTVFANQATYPYVT